MAPASRHSRRTPCISVISSGVAVRSMAASPITQRRMTEWPTSGATLMARPLRMRVMYSEKVSQSQTTPSLKAFSGISSIWLNMPTSLVRYSARSGASESEQLPGTMVVTPCERAGLA